MLDKLGLDKIARLGSKKTEQNEPNVQFPPSDTEHIQDPNISEANTSYVEACSPPNILEQGDSQIISSIQPTIKENSLTTSSKETLKHFTKDQIVILNDLINLKISEIINFKLINYLNSELIEQVIIGNNISEHFCKIIVASLEAKYDFVPTARYYEKKTSLENSITELENRESTLQQGIEELKNVANELSLKAVEMFESALKETFTKVISNMKV